MKGDQVYLDHMLECLHWIGSHTAEGEDVFLGDRKTQSAVLRELQTLAESSQRLSESLRASQPSVPWEYIAGFRNVVVHDYLGLDLRRIWQIVTRDLPPLRTAVLEMKASLERDSA